jgi:hypothetical protein
MKKKEEGPYSSTKNGKRPETTTAEGRGRDDGEIRSNGQPEQLARGRIAPLGK